jgi:AcrR family transcriptional regulator
VSAPVPKRVRRPRTDPDAARETVLAAAEALLRAEGPSALRLGEIAARAGLSHSNVLYHFGGMKDLEARLGRRIALRLAQELERVHRSEAGAELPSAAANGRLFEVLGRPENARLVAWMLVASEPEELEPLAASIRSTCEIVAAHPSFAGAPRDVVFREIAESAQLAIAAALGFGLIRPWVSMAFGVAAEERVFVERLVSAERFRTEGLGKLLTKSQ